jgi:hypothetical protein
MSSEATIVIGLPLWLWIGSGSGTYLSMTGGRPALRELGASVDSVLVDAEDIFLVIYLEVGLGRKGSA